MTRPDEGVTSAATAGLFDATIQTTNVWLEGVMAVLGLEDRHRACHAMRAVLYALRDPLSVQGRQRLAPRY